MNILSFSVYSSGVRARPDPPAIRPVPREKRPGTTGGTGPAAGVRLAGLPFNPVRTSKNMDPRCFRGRSEGHRSHCSRPGCRFHGCIHPFNHHNRDRSTIRPQTVLPAGQPCVMHRWIYGGPPGGSCRRLPAGSAGLHGDGNLAQLDCQSPSRPVSKPFSSMAAFLPGQSVRIRPSGR
jgi:hypothetical protein